MKKHEPLTEEQLLAIKARADAATPGPWVTDGYGVDLEYAISVRQPWAELLLRGEKCVEYRRWSLQEKYVGRWLLLHASQSMSCRERDLALSCLGTTVEFDRGGYVGRIRFGRAIMAFTPLEVRTYCPLPQCWHWPVIDVERLPFCPAKGKTLVFKVEGKKHEQQN